MFMDSGAGYISAVTCQTTGVFLFLCEIKILMLTVSVYHKSLTITPTNSSAVPLLFLRLAICAHVHFTDHFPGEPELASSLLVFFHHLFWKRTFELSGGGFTARCPSCHTVTQPTVLKMICNDFFGCQSKLLVVCL